MTRPLLIALVLALALVVAGCSTSGAHEAGPVPTATSSSRSASTSAGETTSAPPATSTSTAPASVPLCSDKSVAVKIAAQQGAAGTISTTWKVTNTSANECRSFGYPGMDFHTAGGWLDVHVHRGGFANINGQPSRVVLASGQSLWFVSYWNDVDTDQGPCQQFDRVKVTLPDNYRPARLAATGCIDPDTVDVGPVSATRPA
jgi:hypothetical protein